MKKTTHGFTLVELLVAITLMGLVGTFALANFRSFGEDQKLKNAALDVQSLLRTAQTNAVTNTECDSQNGSTWQVVISSSSVLAVTSTSPSPSSSPNGTTVYQVDLKCLESGTTFPKKTLTMDKNITISVAGTVQALRVQTASTTACPDLPVTISFAPLTGKIDLGGSTGPYATCGKLTFTLVNTKTNSTKGLIIERGGSIYVQ